MADGFTLIVPKEMIDRLEVADKKIDQLARTSENASSRIIAAFNEMSTKGVDKFIESLNKAQTELSKLSQTKVNLDSMFNTTKSVSEITNLIDALAKLSKVQNKETGGTTKQETSEAQKINALYRERMNLTKQLSSLMQKREKLASKGGLRAEESAQISTIRSLIQAKEAEINIYKKSANLNTKAKQALMKGEMEYTLMVNEETRKLQAIKDKARQDELNKEKKKQQEIAALDSKNRKNNYNNYVTTYEGALRTSGKAKNLLQEEQAIKNLEAAKAKLNKTDADYANKLETLNQAINKHKQHIKDANLTNEQREKIAKRNTEAAEREAKALERKNKLEQQKRISSNPQEALNYSQNTKSINDQIKAIQYLKQARDGLNKSSFSSEDAYRQKVKQLNDEIRRQQTEIDKLRDKQGRLNESQSKLLNTTDQLQRKLALLFSISAIQGYINKLATVRGEFELQQKSLNALLKNKAQADKLWNQTVQLAVRSPFRVSELVKYTRQLAAYRIETDKLHATTKMLADVSAGLGVDMQRLILAYGQIKTAGFLRGTEVRQLTEAGVSVYEELAKHFTKMENTDVTVAQVIQRISKRQVAFKDVEQIFKNITSEGGAFYEMQEQQANTLKGMISNLRDSIDLMLNDIGKSNESTLKGFVSITKEIIENWRILAVVIKSVSIALAGVALKSFATGWAMVATEGAAAAAAMNGMVGVGARLNIMFKSLATTISANPMLAIAGLIGAGFLAWHDYSKSIDEANQVHNENIKSLIDLQEGLTDVEKKIKKNNKTIQTYNTLEKNASATSEELALAEKQKNDAYTENIQLFDTLKEKYPELYSSITKQKDGVISLNDAIKEQNELLEYEILLQTKGKASTGHDSVNTNAKEATEAWNKYQSKLADVRGAARDAQAKLKELKNTGRYSKEEISSVENYIKVIEKLGKEGYKDVDYIRIRSEAWNKMTDVMKAQMSSVHLSISDATRYAGDAFGSYERAFNNLVENFQRQAPAWQESLSKMLLDPDKGQQRARDFVKKQLDTIGLYRENLRRMAFDEIIGIAQIKVKLTYDTPEGEAEDETKGMLLWQKQLWAIIEKIKAKNPNITIPIKPQDLINGNKEEILEKVRKFAKEVIETSENAIKGYNVKGQKVYTETDKKRNEETKGLGEELLSAAGGFKKENTGGRQSNPAKDFAKVLEDMYKSYQDFNKKFDKDDASERVKKNWTEAFEAAKNKVKGFNLELKDFDFTSIEGLTAAFEKLEKTAQGKKIAADIKKTLSGLTGNRDIEVEEKREELRDREIDQMFELYDIYKDLEKLGIDKKAAKGLFGIDATSLDEMRSKLEQMKAAGQFTGTDDEKAYQKYLDKITEMENKAQQERLKTYLKYSRDAMTDRAKIKFEELQKLAEIEKTFAIKEGDTDEVKEIKNTQRTSAIEAVQKESAQQTNKSLWEDFQKSDIFLSVFQDAENASVTMMEHVLAKLRGFKAEWANMPLESVKQITQKMTELENKLIEAQNPFKALREINKKIQEELTVTTTGADGKEVKTTISKEQLESDATAAQSQIDINNTEIAQLEVINELLTEGKLINSEQQAIYQNLTGDTDVNLDTIKDEVKARKDANKNLQETVDKNNKVNNLQNQGKKALLKQADAIRQCNKMANDLYGAFAEIWEVAGGDEVTKMFADMGMSIATSVLDTIALQMQLTGATTAAEMFGASMNSAMGIIGWIVLAVQITAKVLSTVFAAHDKGLQEDIEKIDEEINVLQKSLEKLEEQLETVYSSTNLVSTMRKANSNIEQQIAKRRQQIELEKEKKSEDEDQIKAWEEEIVELQEKAVEMRKEMVESLGGTYDIRSFAREFADAWIQAFEETGDGLKGLQDNFKEFMKNVLLEQAVMKGLGNIMQPVTDAINTALKNDYQVDKLELNKIEKAAEDAMLQGNIFMKSLFGDGGIFSDYVNDTSSSLSGLQEGIQGVTEETAQIIEAYLNSIRFYIAQDNQNLAKLTQFFTGGEDIENPMLSQLKIIATQTSAIRMVFDSIVRGGHSQGGLGVKVFID